MVEWMSKVADFGATLLKVGGLNSLSLG